MLDADPLWDNSVDHRLSFIAGWGTLDNRSKATKVLAQAREVYSAMFEGRLDALRNGDQASEGNAITFKRDDPRFWVEHRKNARVQFESVELNKQLVAQTLFDEYRVVKREIFSTGRALEGPFVEEMFAGALRYDTFDLDLLEESLTSDHRVLIDLLRRNGDGAEHEPLGDSERDVLSRYGLKEDSPRPTIVAARMMAERAFGWFTLEREFRTLRRKGAFDDVAGTRAALSRKKSFYDNEGADHISYGFERMASLVDELANAQGASPKGHH